MFDVPIEKKDLEPLYAALESKFDFVQIYRTTLNRLRIEVKKDGLVKDDFYASRELANEDDGINFIVNWILEKFNKSVEYYKTAHQ